MTIVIRIENGHVGQWQVKSSFAAASAAMLPGSPT